MKYLDTVVLLVLMGCEFCFEAEGEMLRNVIIIAAICFAYLMIRLHVCAKEEKRKEYWKNRRAYYDIVERERRKQWN